MRRENFSHEATFSWFSDRLALHLRYQSRFLPHKMQFLQQSCRAPLPRNQNSCAFKLPDYSFPFDLSLNTLELSRPANTTFLLVSQLDLPFAKYSCSLARHTQLCTDAMENAHKYAFELFIRKLFPQYTSTQGPRPQF